MADPINPNTPRTTLPTPNTNTGSGAKGTDGAQADTSPSASGTGDTHVYYPVISGLPTSSPSVSSDAYPTPSRSSISILNQVDVTESGFRTGLDESVNGATVYKKGGKYGLGGFANTKCIGATLGIRF